MSKQYTAAQRQAWDAERRDKLAALADKLKAGVKSFSDSDLFKSYLRAAAQFHTYSANNQMLIWLQRRDATRVAGFETWKKLGRTVRKGEKGIAILAPSPFTVRETTEAGDEVEKRFLRFRVVYVFDVSQTDGEPLPEIDWRGAAGTDGEHVYPALVSYAAGKGIPVTQTESQHGEGGSYIPALHAIRVVTDAPSRMVRALAHELAHSQDEGIKAGEKYSTGEAVADSVAFMVCDKFGVPMQEANFAYLASWLRDENGVKVLDSLMPRIQRIASDIIGHVESVLGLAAEVSEAVEAVPVAA
jgi:antirestriction protein ArdC